MKKGLISLLLFWALIIAPNRAAAQASALIDEMQQRLQQMQQRMMQGLQGFDSGRDSSGIFFHFDTTFSGGGNAHFFQFTPPGDSLNGGMSGLEDFFRSMFDFGGPSGSAAETFPREDGHRPHPDDELLPEERLRLQEEQQATKPKKPAAPPAPVPAKKKPQVDSIRI